MRSRYTAFTLKDSAYLAETWDPAGRPEDLNLEQDGTDWTGLRILAVRDGGEGDAAGEVEFKAHYRQGGRAGVLHEVSRFRRNGGQWVYLDGRFPETGPAAAGPVPSRNGPCPCGSGKKYKRCCG
jgi:SEC-C motif-containing protein